MSIHLREAVEPREYVRTAADMKLGANGLTAFWCGLLSVRNAMWLKLIVTFVG
jgi:hypothetical protein